MKMENLVKFKTKGAKRIGRGQGSGKGKTARRGTKGQNARSKLPITHSHYEGGQRPLMKRLPYRRGKGNPKISKKPIAVNIDSLNMFPKNEIVTIDSLIKFKVVEKNDAKHYGVKVLGNGDLKNPLTINVKVSKSAAEKIKKAGGKILTENQK